jgi:hypothetical protein
VVERVVEVVADEALMEKIRGEMKAEIEAKVGRWGSRLLSLGVGCMHARMVVHACMRPVTRQTAGGQHLEMRKGSGLQEGKIALACSHAGAV